jgi:hypothetical protein
MPTNRGRPRVTAEELQVRIATYCQKYGVAPNAAGLPPFPSGRRETRQHRDWMAVYKAHSRIARRPPDAGESGRCAVCDGHLEPSEAVDYAGSNGVRALLHSGCHRLASLAQSLGPNSLDRLRVLLWPARKAGARS